MRTRAKQKRRRRTRKQKQRGGSTTVPICIYSHSDVFDVLQIQFDYLTKLFKGTAQPIYLIANKNFDGQTEVKYTTILYDDSKAYMERLATSVKQVPAPYFILSHENDVLLQYDASAINALVGAMKEHQIDSIDLKHHDTSEERIEVTPTMFIKKALNEMTFCVQPRLWKKESAINLFGANPAVDYRNAETEVVQKYIKANQKTYEVTSTAPIQSWYFGVNKAIPEYLFIHITNANMFSPKPEARYNVDPIVQKELDAIQQKYIDIPERKREQIEKSIMP